MTYLIEKTTTGKHGQVKAGLISCLENGTKKTMWVQARSLKGAKEGDYIELSSTLEKRFKEEAKTAKEIEEAKWILAPTPHWENDKCVGFDVIISYFSFKHDDIIGVKRRIFIPKNPKCYNDKKIATWILEKKIITIVVDEKLSDGSFLRFANEHDGDIVSGFLDEFLD